MAYTSLFDLWKQSSEKFKDKIALSDGSGKVQISYRRAFKEICYFASLYSSWGIQSSDKVCIFSENNPHWLLLEQAAITLGAVSVAKNSMNSIEELDYVFHNSDSVALISDKLEIINYFLDLDKDFLNKVKFVLYVGTEDTSGLHPDIKLFDDVFKNFDENAEIFTDYKNNPEDVCYIHYTSGTSSKPKGAILVNEGMYYQVEEIQRFLDGYRPQTFIATFPLASAGGKCFNLFCVSIGCKIVYTPYKNFFDLVVEKRPDFLHCAPKIMMTLYGNYLAKIEEQGPVFKLLFNLSKKITMFLIKMQRNIYKKRPANTESKGFGKVLENILDSLRKVQDKLIYKKIRNFFLKDGMLIAVGSASLAKEAEDFYNIIGVDIVQHYGMTETTGLTTHATVKDQKERPYTVGIFFSRTKFKIVDPETSEILGPDQTGLLLIQGPEVTKGYYNNEEATKKALTEDGWLITGDLARYSSDKYVTILSRYDDVIVMMNGYNVYAPLLQDQANSSPFVHQMVVVGHGKPYLSGLVVLNIDEYDKWCRAKGITVDPNNNEEFKVYLIDELNKLISKKEHHHYFEKIKKVYFLKDEFTVANGTLTNTLKIKYRKICDIYRDEIENMYK